MSFLQAYYTSCEIGLRGGKGFQFNAVTPNLSAEVLQQVERLGVYLPPVSAPTRPTADEIAGFPVSLLYQRLGNGQAVLAQAKYIGTDYSGRYGNYFTHSLITEDAATDIKSQGFLPIEMWQSAVWADAVSPSMSLPALSKVETGHAITLQRVAEFLAEQQRLQYLEPMITAVEQAMRRTRRIIIVDDLDAIALWIAAVSYALPWHLAMQLTFNTYVKNPYQAEFLMVGTTPDSDFKFTPYEIEHLFYVFDFVGERFTHIAEMSGFASEVSYAYEINGGDLVADFSSLAEQVAPDLTLDELSTAYGCHLLLNGVGLNCTDKAAILQWCAGRLTRFRPEQVRALFQKVTDCGAENGEVLTACTDLYAAATRLRGRVDLCAAIERLYLEWLITRAWSAADAKAFQQTVERIDIAEDIADKMKQYADHWLACLCEARDVSHFCALLTLGGKLRFLEKHAEKAGLEIGSALSHPVAQTTLLKLIDDPSLHGLACGVGAYLKIYTDDRSTGRGDANDGLLSLFRSAASTLSREPLWGLLIDYAIEHKAASLYFRLIAVRACQPTNGPTRRLDALRQCLDLFKNRMGVALQARHVDEAFLSIWQADLPTVDEAMQLLGGLYLPYLEGGIVLQRIADAIALSDPGQETKKKKRIVGELLTEPLCLLLNDPTAVEAYNYVIGLQENRADIDNVVYDASHFLAKYGSHLPAALKATAYNLLAERLVSVRNSQFHHTALLQCYRHGPKDFISRYGSTVESALAKRSPARPAVAARLFEIWRSTGERRGDQLASTLLEVYLPRALKNWKAQELNRVGACLATDRALLRDWDMWRDSYAQKGMVMKIFERFASGRQPD